jgi:hypothetical protein
LTEENDNPSGASDLNDLVLELNFVPRWARGAPSQQAGSAASEPTRDRPQRDRHADQDRRGARPERPGANRGDRGTTPQRHDRFSTRPPAYERPQPPPRLPLRISLVPEQRQLSSMLHQLQVARKAYPLANLASLLCAKPEFCCAKIELERSGTVCELYQCKTCRTLSLDRAAMALHVVRSHLEEYFDKVETESEAPTGQFTCVARCGLSGILLGPPNHHSYSEKLQEVHRTKYANLSLEEYRAKIEMKHEPELIEKWKEESRRATTFKLKGAPDGDDAKPLSWSAAEALFQRRIAPGLVTRVQRAVVTVAQAMQMEDVPLQRAIRDAWQRETRSPRTMLFALRAVFRHKDLHLFKVGAGWDYVCPIRPSPLELKHVIPAIREVLTHLQTHPGCRRKELVEALRPGAAEDSAPAAEVLSPLGWLIEKGHILEFFDGSLSVPLKARRQTPAETAPPADVEPA